MFFYFTKKIVPWSLGWGFFLWLQSHSCSSCGQSHILQEEKQWQCWQHVWDLQSESIAQVGHPALPKLLEALLSHIWVFGLSQDTASGIWAGNIEFLLVSKEPSFQADERQKTWRSPGSWQNGTVQTCFWEGSCWRRGVLWCYVSCNSERFLPHEFYKYFYKVMSLNPPAKASKLTNFMTPSWSLLWFSWVFIGNGRKAASLSHPSLVKCYSTSRAATTLLWQSKPKEWTKALQVCSKPG